MSMEMPRRETFENMKLEADEHTKELEMKYPTIDSIVDDYRMAHIGMSTVAYRFPDKKDQEEVIRLATERNVAEGLTE